MRGRRAACIGFMAGVMLTAGCGDEIAEQQPARAEAPRVPACELVRPSDLQQIFVNPLEVDRTMESPERLCIWNDADTQQPFVSYELHPYVEDLQSQVDRLEEQLGGSVNARFLQGTGDAAVWTDAGLFVNRNGRTLQVRPLQDDADKSPYQELARLLLTRLEGQ